MLGQPQIHGAAPSPLAVPASPACAAVEAGKLAQVCKQRVFGCSVSGGGGALALSALFWKWSPSLPSFSFDSFDILGS